MAHFTLARMAQSAIHTHKDRVSDITEAVRLARKDGLLPGTQAEAVKEIRKLIAEQRKTHKSRRKFRPGADALTMPLLLRAGRRSAALLERVYNSLSYRTWKRAHQTVIKIGTPAVHSYTDRGSVHTLTIPPLWCVRVKARDLAVCDGMVTLDAERVPGVGPELYRAVWVEQGPGSSLKLARGYIARLDCTAGLDPLGRDVHTAPGVLTYHAATARGALAGIRRKAGLLPLRRAIDLDRLSRRYGTIPVTLDDSFAVGNCRSGTLSWSNAVGLDVSAESATLAEVISAYRLRPMPEALAVIRHVIKEHRQWAKVLREPRGRVRFDQEGGFRVED